MRVVVDQRSILNKVLDGHVKGASDRNLSSGARLRSITDNNPLSQYHDTRPNGHGFAAFR
jgi:hypothetical protein